MNRPVRPLLERIIAKLGPTTPEGCWPWTGATFSGYGVIGRGRRTEGTVQTHRAMFELLRGPVPDGLQLDHLCRNRACCNPDHLEPVTQRENILRGMSAAARHARKTHCIHGHPFNEANTHVDSLGRRVCRACRRQRNKRDKKKETAA